MSKRESTTDQQRKKFLFDVHNFDEPEVDGPEEEPPPPVYSVEELASAKRDSYAQGRHDGNAEAQASFEKQIADTLAVIRDNFSILFDAEERRSRTFEKEAVQLAYTIFAKAFPALNEQYGLEDVKATIKNVLETVREQPEVIIEVPQAHVETIQKHVDTLLRMDGGPRCIIRANDRLGAGECRMAWVNGSAARNAPGLSDQIRVKIEQVLAENAILPDNEQDQDLTLSADMTTNGDSNG